MHIIIGFAILVVLFSLFPRQTLLLGAIGVGGFLLLVLIAFSVSHS